MKRHALALLLLCGWLLPTAAVSAQTPDIQRRIDRLLRGQGRGSPKLARALDQTVDYPGLTDPRATLHDFLLDLNRRYGLVFDVDEDGFRAEGVEDVVETPLGPAGVPPMKQVTVYQVLQRALGRVKTRSGVFVVVRGDGVDITTRPGALAAWRDQWARLGVRFGTLGQQVTLTDPAVRDALELAADAADVIRQHKRLSLPKAAE